MKTKSTMVSVGTQRLRVTVENPGAGQPLLLINGIGATGDLFDPFRQHFSDRETIAFDAPGVGGSPTPILPYSMRKLAGTVAGLVDELGHSRVDVLGLSWGGALAQEFAHRQPGMVRRLILTATMPGVTSVPGRPAAVATLMSPMRYYSPEYLKRVAPTLYGGAIRDNPELLDEHARQRAARPPSTVGYIHQLSAIQRWSSLPWLHRLPHRSLVLAGDDDPIVRLVNARILASRIPDARLHVVEGGGHLFLFTRAKELADIVADFLDSGASKAIRQL
ncbi:alpha/beta fold hydrolase [Acidimicrobiales bacterium]|nr:alpha/beta fold hydrolase [Acidimicrobiales bacterium]